MTQLVADLAQGSHDSDAVENAYEQRYSPLPAPLADLLLLKAPTPFSLASCLLHNNDAVQLTHALTLT